MKKIIGLGNALSDVLTVLKSDDLLADLNLPKGSMQLIDAKTSAAIQDKIKDGECFYVTGGSASNTISGLAALGNPCGFIGKIGEDKVGSFFDEDMQKHGVVTKMIKSTQPSGVCVSLVSPDGERTMATFLGAASEMTASDLKVEMFQGYDICHIEGYLVQNHEMIERAMQLAKEAGLKVSLDLASYNVVEENYDFIYRLVHQYVDIVFANEEEAKAFAKMAPEEAVDMIANLCEIAVVKLGKRGSLVKYQGETTHVDILGGVNAVDTTGAGDLFAAGFLYGYSNGYPMAKCGKIGSLVSGNIVKVVGAKLPAEKWAEMKSEIETY